MPFRPLWPIIRRRKRLALSALFGVAVFALAGSMAASTRGLLGWNAGAGLYLLWSWIGML